MKDKKGYEIQVEISVIFNRPSSDGKLTQKVLGDVIDIINNKQIIVQDEESDTYTVKADDVEVVIDRECQDCGEEFNSMDTDTCMEEATGKTLIEVPCCPHCRSTEIINITPKIFS